MEQVRLKKRKQQAMETKERIYSATIGLIEEKGFNNVLMEDIAQRAGVSAGLFYNYFANKADVLTEAFYYRSKKYYQTMREEYLLGTRGLAKLKLIIHHVARLRQEVYDKEELCNHHTNLLVMHDRLEGVHENSSLLFEMLSEALREARDDRELPADADLARIEEAVSLALRGATWEYLTTDGPYPFEARAWDVIDLYIRGTVALG